jgi:hypothetical protein
MIILFMAIGGYFKLNYRMLLMVINECSISGY